MPITRNCRRGKAGYPPRRWTLYDVYPLDGEPLFWRYKYECEVEWLNWPADDAPIIEW